MSKGAPLDSTHVEWVWHQNNSYVWLQSWQIASLWILKLKAVQQACQDQEELNLCQRLT